MNVINADKAVTAASAAPPEACSALLYSILRIYIKLYSIYQ